MSLEIPKYMRDMDDVALGRLRAGYEKRQQAGGKMLNGKTATGVGLFFLATMLFPAGVTALAAMFLFTTAFGAYVFTRAIPDEKIHLIDKLKAERDPGFTAAAPNAGPSALDAQCDLGRAFNQGTERCVTVKPLKLKTVPQPSEPAV